MLTNMFFIQIISYHLLRRLLQTEPAAAISVRVSLSVNALE